MDLQAATETLSLLYRFSRRSRRVIGRWLVYGLCWLALFVAATIQLTAQTITPSEKSLPLPGESFKLGGQDAFIIAPSEIRTDTPWVWYAPTLRNLPGQAEIWMFGRFLKARIAIAGIDVGESFGSPKGRAGFTRLYEYLVKERQFSRRPVLLARSRGGLMLYSWAAEHADCVAGIAGIYPVCNLESYPGLERAAGAYDLSAKQLEEELKQHNPIERLQALAQAHVPLFHLHGDSDQVVPLEANSAIVAERYKRLGGPMTLEVVEGQGHNMWSGWFENEKLVDFVIVNAK